MEISHDRPAILFSDNQAAIHLAVNPVFHEWSKHIEVDCRLIHDKIQRGVVKTFLAQIKLRPSFTKALSFPNFS